MLYEQHHKLIKKATQKNDIAIWNKWRQGNPDVRPDLRGANLSETDLRGVDLIEVDLSGANLKGTDLSYTDLSGSDFNNINLMRSHFSAANLTGVSVGQTLVKRTLATQILVTRYFWERSSMGQT